MAAPLAVFRILFGLLMVFSLIRFWYYDWIAKFYILPKTHFHYYGFEWVQVPGNWTYLLFIICGFSALFFAIGFKYRISIVVFFLSFSYIELMDKTTYLNHYYFVSLVAFLLIWIPAHVHFSVDAHRNSTLRCEFVPRWYLTALQAMISIVYIYAGLAKLNKDWMLDALPLSIWLRSKVDLPLIGQIMDERWLHFMFSWGGALYDLCIVFFLIWSRTRIFAFVIVLFFHLMTKILFPIGMFPYLMITATLLFFSGEFHTRILKGVSKLCSISYKKFCNGISFRSEKYMQNLTVSVFTVFFLLQVLIPLRGFAYPGNMFWTEQGYRFSWRVMLMEKTAYANFKVVDSLSGKRFYVQNEDFLTAFQQKQMATQADFMIEYAHYLADHFESQGHENLQIFVESYASLNGRKSQVYMDPNVDLLTLKDDWKHRSYIKALKDD